MSDDGLTTLPNAFQRLMLQWERFAPYNAAQFLTMPVAALRRDPCRAWRTSVIGLGLQQIGQHPDAPLDYADGGVESFVSDALNARFEPRTSPLRPFLVSDGDDVHLGIVYRHVVADSASIRLVMREWFARLYGVARAKSFVSLDRRAGLKLFDPERRWSLPGQAVAEISRLSRAKRVRRLGHADPTRPVAWRNVAMPDGTIDRLLAYARSRGASVNDLFVASAALACAAHLPLEARGRRRDMGVGTIVDTRARGDSPMRRFGLSLGFLQTFWRDREIDAGWDATLAIASRASRLARERSLADASGLRLAAARWFGDRLGDRALAEFYRKRCPLVAGVSNVNLNREWPSRLHPSPIARYSRVSPTGPMLPVVFTPTTLGGTLNVGFTWRTGDVDDASANAIVAAFVERLQSLS